MDRQVFQSNKVIPMMILAIVFIGSIIAYIQVNIPIWVIPIVLVIGVFVVFTTSKTKLIIENGLLRYEKLFGGEEVDLKSVSQIVMREVETIVNNVDSRERDRFYNQEDVKFGTVRVNNNAQPMNQARKVEKIIYILDEAGRTIFSLPANTVRFTERTRFREAVQAVNPNIHVF